VGENAVPIEYESFSFAVKEKARAKSLAFLHGNEINLVIVSLTYHNLTRFFFD